jgi:fructose-1,6-bisphosphatase-3
VDRLHIVGDIFDRGPRADIIMDALIRHHSVDIQWGNHDILWMGAAAGSRTCIANVLNNSITYNNLQVIETGYGISLRPLALFAAETYADTDVSCFTPRLLDEGEYKPKDIDLVARMHKALAILLFKLEGQIIRRNPSFQMEDRLLLDKINYDDGTVLIDGICYPLRDWDFPTVCREDPYRLSPEEAELMDQLAAAFCHSEKLQRHVRFLYANGGLYKCFNGNLLFHGCIPMEEDGSFTRFDCGESLSGRAYMDHVEAMARQGYYARHGSVQRQYGKDFLWFLWCGHNSPLFGRDRMTTFERLLIADRSSWTEKKNPYYRYCAEEACCLKILREFGLTGEHSHIINGHVPVRSKDGENPVKANGRLIVIDGGLCRAYQPQTGIAGYTLVYNSYGIRIISHEPFESRQAAIEGNKDILSSSTVFETLSRRLRVSDTDAGRELTERSEGLSMLLAAYRMGLIQERQGR